ncbi:hypothetical protein [Nocardioides pakistanensis]
MTYLTESRDTLAKAIWAASRADEGTISYLGANIVADALIASGAVIDASTLADDKALIERLARATSAADDEALTRTNFEHLSATYDEQAEAALRALAAALTERGDQP